MELIPNGDDEYRRVLGQLEIANTDGDAIATGAYCIVMQEYDEDSHGRSSTFRTTASLEGVERDIVRPMQLVGLALSVVAPVKRTMHSSQDGPLGTIVTRGPI